MQRVRNRAEIQRRLCEFTDRVLGAQAYKNAFYQRPDGSTNLTPPDAVHQFLVANWHAFHNLAQDGSRTERRAVVRRAALYSENATILTLLRANQYLEADRNLHTRLRDLYQTTLDRVIDLCSGAAPDLQPVEQAVHEHQVRLRAILQSYEELTLFPREQPRIRPIPCGEYSAELQLRVLNVSLSELREPILDIGCGREANLVRHLVDQGLDAHGLDRIVEPGPHIRRVDWLDERYAPASWGTIISHLAFSNHLTRHHLRRNGNWVRYADKYVEILRALRVGGSFVYVPDLPFVECHLPPLEFRVAHTPVSTASSDTSNFHAPLRSLPFRASRVTRG